MGVCNSEGALNCPEFDAVVVGAGAAGLHCAAIAGQRGVRVLVVDHAERVAEKIRISGGGRCNFTNTQTTASNFLSENPSFCRSALARYTPHDFVGLVQRHGIAWHEKHRGQLFCDGSSDEIVQMLLRECAAGGVTRWQPCAVRAVRHGALGYALDTDRGVVQAAQLVVATGGLSIPQLGASGFGLALARQFGHAIVPTRAALVPLTFAREDWAPYAELAGLSLPVGIATGGARIDTAFEEDLLFTHRGLSGPAVLQISSYWQPGTPLRIDLGPGQDLRQALGELKAHSSRQLLSELAERVPRRLAQVWTRDAPERARRPMPEQRDRDLQTLAQSLHRWELTPTGTEGYRKAEVMAGGVDTRAVSSQTLQSTLHAGLHFIGEVVDVTGWLGGYNFQWAWASAAACARALHGPERA